MACSIERQKQIVEAAKSEYKRLAQLQKQGYDSDLENGIYDIAEAMNNMRAIVYKKPENIVESEVTPIDEIFINELNNNKPKDGKVNIEVLSGVRTASGKLIYTVKYPNNEKEYKLPASRISADQVSANAWYGSDENTGIGETENDMFLGQEELELGQVLADDFAAYYDADVQEGREIQTQEFADLQNYIVGTYQETMKNLGTGNVKLRMFESLTENTAGQIDLRTKEMHIRWNKMSRLSRVSEVFLHEINHSMSHHVFKENIKLRRLMEDLRDSAVESGVTYKLFLE